jgi:hypothetical protein
VANDVAARFGGNHYIRLLTQSWGALNDVSLTGISFFHLSSRRRTIDTRQRTSTISLYPAFSFPPGFQKMPDAAVYVVPDADFDDWIVRIDTGDEIAHYATREAAELVAQQIAQERAIDLVVKLPDGRTTRKSFTKGWVSKLFGG